MIAVWLGVSLNEYQSEWDLDRMCGSTSVRVREWVATIRGSPCTSESLYEVVVEVCWGAGRLWVDECLYVGQ